MVKALPPVEKTSIRMNERRGQRSKKVTVTVLGFALEGFRVCGDAMDWGLAA